MIRSFLRKGAISNEAACLATGAPNQPGGLTATGGVGTISLSWTADSTAAPNQATYYEVERSNDGLGSWSVIATNLGTNSYTDTVAAGLTRHYRVYAYNCDSGSLASATANATSQSGALSPSWSLDFSSGTPSGYTLTRASSGTYMDSSGYIASASTDVARLTHNSSGSRLGLLVEESRTNQLASSENFGSPWTLLGVTKTDNATTSPDGTNNATRLVETSATVVHETYALISNMTTGVNVVYMKADQRTAATVTISRTTNEWVACTFDLSNGIAGAVATGSGSVFSSATAGIESVGNGWYRCWVAATASSQGNWYVAIGLNTSTTPTRQASNGQESYAGNTANGIYVWGAQMENINGQPSSYIKTTGSSVTRSADLAHVLDSSITSWGDPGALVIHFYPPGQAGTLLSTDDASTAQVGIEASSTTAARAFWSSGSTSTGTIGTGVQKAVHYWNGSTSKFAINGSTPVSGTNNLTIGNTDFVTLGAEATDSSGVPGTFSQYANCVIRKVEFYSGTLTDANLQTITT